MAWNPSPQVAVARDAAERLGTIVGNGIKHCVVVYTTDDGRLGYASYGDSPIECTRAQRLANRLYDAAMNFLSGRAALAEAKEK